MYTPSNNRAEDRAQRIGFMREYNFAALVTQAADGSLQATHLPFMLADDGATLSLQAHMAQANPQWRDFAADREVMVIFAGPHAYISPSLYDRKPSVPTWNYLAVHAYGRASCLHGHDNKIDTLERLIEGHEPAFQQEFAELPKPYLDMRLDAIVAFEIEVARLEARFKLSQDRTPSEHRTIVASLAASEDSTVQTLAAKMQSNSEAR